MKYSNRKGLTLITSMLAAALANPNRDFNEPQVHIYRFSEKSKVLFREPYRQLKEFSIKGHNVMAYSRKDAITRLKHQKKI